MNRKQDNGAMRVAESTDRRSGEVVTYKLKPEEIKKLFEDVKAEPKKICPNYSLKFKGDG